MNSFNISPIGGIAVSFDTGNNSYLFTPDKYPEGYYLPNAVHFTLFTGLNLHKDFSNKIIKGADFYVELGAVETYLWYAISTKEVLLNQVVSMALGVNFYF